MLEVSERSEMLSSSVAKEERSSIGDRLAKAHTAFERVLLQHT